MVSEIPWVSSGRGRISWLFFKAVRAGLAVATSLSRSIRKERVRGRRTEKQPTGHGPEGCVENGPVAVRRPPDRLRIDSDMVRWCQGRKLLC
jgi:hypothetical protein